MVTAEREQEDNHGKLEEAMAAVNCMGACLKERRLLLRGGYPNIEELRKSILRKQERGGLARGWSQLLDLNGQWELSRRRDGQFQVKGEGMGPQTLHRRMNVVSSMVAKAPYVGHLWPPHISHHAIHTKNQQVFELPNAKYNWGALQ